MKPRLPPKNAHFLICSTSTQSIIWTMLGHWTGAKCLKSCQFTATEEWPKGSQSFTNKLQVTIHNMKLDISTHKTILFQLLKEIYSDTTISPFLGFKGGTALLMFYGLDRFSVDLDFDLLDETRADLVFERIVSILPRYGRLREFRKKRFNLFCVLSYEDKARQVK